MNLLAGFLSLAIFAIIVRCAVLPNLIRLCSLCSGVVLYVGLHLFVTGQSISGNGFGSIWGESRLWLFLGASILFAVLARFAVLPFLGIASSRLPDDRSFHLPSPAVHVGVWIGGSVLIRILCFRPSPFSGDAFHLTRADLPLLSFSWTALLALILWKLKTEYGGKQQEAMSAGDTVEPARERPVKEARDLQQRIEKLQLDAAAAERRWAVAVLQERAARICAERLAQEFAEVRKMKEPQQEKPRPLSIREAFAVFNLSPGCDAESLRESYHRLILQNHPDKVAALGPQLRAVAERETKNINVAYSLALRHALTVSPTSAASRTPFRATADCQRASGPSDSHRENRGTLMGRPGVAMR